MSHPRMLVKDNDKVTVGGDRRVAQHHKIYGHNVDEPVQLAQTVVGRVSQEVSALCDVGQCLERTAEDAEEQRGQAQVCETRLDGGALFCLVPQNVQQDDSAKEAYQDDRYRQIAQDSGYSGIARQSDV